MIISQFLRPRVEQLQFAQIQYRYRFPPNPVLLPKMLLPLPVKLPPLKAHLYTKATHCKLPPQHLNVVPELTKDSSTSPSIYVDFYSLSATDSCGLLGPVITSTLLSFAPGELSTIGQPIANLNDDFNLGHYLLTNIQPFNFADLPCPPYSVMVSPFAPNIHLCPP